MGKLVILRLGDGSFEEGFPVMLQMGEDGDRPSTEIAGKLPPNPEIPRYYSYWQSAYYRLGLRSRLEAASVQITNVSVMEDCNNAAEQLCKSLNAWLHSESFRPVREKLLAQLMPSDTVRAIFQTEDPLVQRLPWHLCDLFAPYSKAEIALSAPVYESAGKVTPQRSKIRILAILGSSTGIDIQADRVLLEHLPDVEVCFLVEPQRQELNNQLWAQQGWDILFFAGHSASQVSCDTGRIYINRTESLTISDLKHALQTAVARGLKLAIFNSCDGLGLARDIASLQIPQVVVMREPVPDRVAQEFLKYFLQTFAGGKSLYLSVREAREKLQGWESQFPCASWLPVIYQNPAEVPPTWQGLVKCDRVISRRKLPALLLTSVVVTVLVMGVRYLGMLQGLELSAYDHLMRLQPEAEPDSRILVVAVTEEDLQLPEQKQRKGSLSDLALKQLLQKLKQFKPQVVGLDIYRDFPVESEYADLATQMKQSDRFIAICRDSDSEVEPNGVAPPPEIRPEGLGFSDVVLDPDNILRRYLLTITPSPASPCTASYAFSLQLALRYLRATKGILPQYTKQEYLQLGTTVFKPLEAHTGGYHNIDAKGYQVLLNNRPRQKVAHQVTLTQVLTDRVNPSLVKDGIIIIGTTAPSFKDYLSTPYQQKVPGVLVQAQMVSQILSTVLDRQPLIWVWSQSAEFLWVWSWSLVGGMLVWRFQFLPRLCLAGGVALGTLYLFCFGLFTQGGWIPLIPSALALVATSGSAIALTTSQTKQQQKTFVLLHSEF